MKFRAFPVFLILFAFLWTAVPAQTGAGPLEVPGPEARTFSNPYSVGETLEYEGKYKKFGFSFGIAEMIFNVRQNEGDEVYQIVSEARSKGTLAKLFNFSFYQKIESTVDSRTLQVVRSIKRDEQKDRIRDSEANFDYLLKRVTWVETDPNDPVKPPKKVASTITSETQDLVTGVFVLRGKDLAVGKTLMFKVTDSGLVYDVPVKVTGREYEKTLFGKVLCWKVEPEIFGDGRVIEQKGSLTIWLTADERRIPVRAKLNTELGRVEIKLEKYVSPSGETVVD